MTSSCSPVEARRLSKRLGDRMVLRGIDLRIAAGECVALTGGNGAGKTTLLRCLAGLARPTTGEVCWFGQPAKDGCSQRSLVGMVAHEGRLYAHLTLRENLVFAARMWAIPAPRERADALLERIGLKSVADRHARQVSKGMRQKLSVARALLHEPPILLLDEPFSGLDATGRQWLAAYLREQKEAGRAVCLATHDEEPARQLADRRFDLGQGASTGWHVRSALAIGTNQERETSERWQANCGG